MLDRDWDCIILPLFDYIFVLVIPLQQRFFSPPGSGGRRRRKPAAAQQESAGWRLRAASTITPPSVRVGAVDWHPSIGRSPNVPAAGRGRRASPRKKRRTTTPTIGADEDARSPRPPLPPISSSIAPRSAGGRVSDEQQPSRAALAARRPSVPWSEPRIRRDQIGQQMLHRLHDEWRAATVRRELEKELSSIGRTEKSP